MEPPTTESGSGLYRTANHRSESQLAEMRRLEAEGVCVFCPGEIATNPAHPILHLTEWWTVTRNRYPYANTRLHLLLIPSIHVSDVDALPLAAKADLWDVISWAKERFSLQFYGLGVRCGDCTLTGGSIEHVHMHLLVGDVEDPAHEPVRMKFSSRRA